MGPKGRFFVFFLIDVVIKRVFMRKSPDMIHFFVQVFPGIKAYLSHYDNYRLSICLKMIYYCIKFEDCNMLLMPLYFVWWEYEGTIRDITVCGAGFLLH